MKINITPLVTSILIPVLLVWLLRPRKKTKEEEKQEEQGRYTIQYGKELKIFMCIGLLFFGALFVFSLGNDLHWWKANSSAWATIGSGLIVLFFLYVIGGTCIWRIRVNGDDIAYRNMFGITKHYKMSEIDHVEFEPKRWVFYKQGKKVFVIDYNLPDGGLLADAIEMQEQNRQKLGQKDE